VAQPGTVTAVSPTDSGPALKQYATTHGVPFKFHAVRTGPFVEALPRHATPVTLVVKESRLIGVYTGVLGDSAVAEIHRAVSRIPDLGL
jgi:hypothetical protein